MESPLLTQPVRPALIKMATPAAFGMLMTFMFQLVDTYFVGQLGTAELAAMSYSYPIYILVVSFFMGTAAGVSSTIGRALGQGDKQKAQRLTGIAIFVFMLITGVIGWLGVAFVAPVFTLLGANEETLPLVTQYMVPLYFGMFLFVGGLIANSALMAKGIMVKSTIVMGIGGIVNVVFDYLLIFGVGPFPALALEGAAIATLLSWFTIFVLMFILLVKEQLVSFSFFAHAKQSIQYFSEIMTISTPAIAAQILNPIAIAVITRTVAGYGEPSVAAFGIATRVESLILVGVLSLSVILTPFAAQNYGANALKRLEQVVAHSGRMTVYWGLLFFILIVTLSEFVLGVFTTDTAIIHSGQGYFYIVGASFPAFGLTLITTSFFNGVQQPGLSLKITLIKSLVLTIPLAILGSLISLEMVWAGVALANVIGAVYAHGLLNQWLRNEGSTLAQHSPITDYRDDFKQLKSHLVSMAKFKS